MAAPKPVKQEKPEAPPQLQPAPAPKPKRRKMLVIAIAATVLVLACGGGAAWFLMKSNAAHETAAAPAAAPKPKTEKPKLAIFVPLDTFTVNLQPETGDRYLQTTLSLKVADAGAEQAIKQQMPEIRSKLLLLLSSKRGSELISMEGKQALANQIAEQVNRVLNPDAPPPQPAKAPEGAGAAATGEQAGATPGAAASAAPETPAAEGPVLSVLFTNFIIQ